MKQTKEEEQQQTFDYLRNISVETKQNKKSIK